MTIQEGECRMPEPLINYIGGAWQRGGGADLVSKNPAHHREAVAQGNEASVEDAARAVEAADRAYDMWRNTPIPKRAEYFRRLMLALGDPEDRENALINDLARLIAKEAGKPINEARADVVEGMHMIDTVFARGRMPIGERVPSEFADKLIYTERVPRGITAVITPWNFPFAIPFWMLGPALIMGNTVVFKPAEQTALVGQRIVELCEKAGFPPGVINLVHGGRTPGEALVRDRRVRSVLFTGSYTVGRQIKRICADDDELDKIAVLETGSKSGSIILPDMFESEEFLRLATKATYQSAFRTSGQRCVSEGRVFVPRQFIKTFVDLLMSDIETNVRVGDPLAPDTFMGPLIDEEGFSKVFNYNDLVRQRARRKRVAGITILADGAVNDEEGYYIHPFVYLMDRYDPDLVTMREEVFGPHLAIIPVQDTDEAVRFFEEAPYNLAVSLHTRTNAWFDVFQKMRHKALFYVNLPHVGAEVQLPFGGTRRSGTGMASASEMFEHVSHPVAITVNMGKAIKLAQGLK